MRTAIVIGKGHHVMHVLVVDDSAAIRARLLEMLTTIDGVEAVDTSASFAEATQFLRANSPDVAVLDIRMPGGSGLDLLRAIRTAGLPIVTIMLTNHADPYFRAACLAAGADFFFDKSSEFERVGDVVALRVCDRTLRTNDTPAVSGTQEESQEHEE